MSAHAASQQRRPPAPPLQLTRAPLVMRSRARLLRAMLYAVGLLLAGGVVAVGWVVGSPVAQRKAVPAAPWRTIALGPATLEAPAGWQPEALSAPGVQGLPEPAVAFATVPGLQAHAVLAIAPAGRSPDVALERFLGPLGTPRRSQVAGRPAQTYAVRPVPGDRMAEATLAPTAAGTLLILCIAKSAAWAGAAGCADALRQRSLRVVPAKT